MPFLDSGCAYGNVHVSPTHIWSTPNKTPIEDVVAENGGARIYGDLSAGLGYDRKFGVESKMNVFTMGSCFARNIEVALYERKFAVTTMINEYPYSHGCLNRYNTPSMLQEIAFGMGTKQFQPESIVKLPNGYADLTSYGLFDSQEEVIQCRATTSALFAKIVEADLVIITAGLSEVWYDKAHDSYLNIAPSQAANAEPGRFEFRLLDYGENVRALHDLVALIHDRAPNAKVLMTVSPVALGATFIKRDVLISNAYSKACLRAAVEEIYWSYDFVDYFPSYEMVTLSRPELVWESDRRHVKASFVDRIMQAFVNTYIDA